MLPLRDTPANENQVLRLRCIESDMILEQESNQEIEKKGHHEVAWHPPNGLAAKGHLLEHIVNKSLMFHKVKSLSSSVPFTLCPLSISPAKPARDIEQGTERLATYDRELHYIPPRRTSSSWRP